MPRHRKTTTTSAHSAADVLAAPVPNPVSDPDPATLDASTSRPTPPRTASKIGIVLRLLQAPEGAGLAKLIEVTGWLPHTTRAALTGLRKRGYTVVAEKILGIGGVKTSVYRIQGEAQ